MREIRLALLEADVELGVVSTFVERVRERALGEEVLKSLTPGQQVVKVVHDELTELLGGDTAELELGRSSVILLAGLQGSGKTTTAAKLALQLKEQGRKPALVAADLARPAAIDQLEQLGAQIDVPVYRTDTTDPVVAAREGLERARADHRDTVIIDTAGRLQVDEALMDELEHVRDATSPTNALLVLDAMTGQQAAAVATAFQEKIAFDGVVLTKLDGDARGGAALSVQDRHRPPDHVRLDRREARPDRGLPPGADGLADPRHGRRAHPDRARRAGLLGRGDGPLRGADAQGAVHLRRLPAGPEACSAGWGRSRAC